MQTQYNQLQVLSNEDYHANKERIGHSGIVKILKSPAHFLSSITEPSSSNVDFTFGSAAHALMLEPALFESAYAVVDEGLLLGTLSSIEDYKAAADELGVKYDAWNKDDLKKAIKAIEGCSFRFKDDVQTEMAAMQQQRIVGTLHSLDEFKAAATSLGIDIGKMKKDELKAAILASDTESRFSFRDEVLAEIERLTQERLVGCLQSLDDFKAAATSLGIKFEPLSKGELKVAILVADTESRFSFREDRYAELYGAVTVLKPEDNEKLHRMQEVLYQHTGAVRLLRAGFAERSVFWEDPETGVSCKIRPDWLAVDEYGEIVAIVDYKTTRDASLNGFAKSCAQYGYDIQAGMYTDGMLKAIGKELPFIFIAQEKDAPFAACVYQADEQMVRVGREKYLAALKLYRDCLDTGRWPAYQSSGEIEQISLPRWASNSEDYEGFNASWSALPQQERHAA